MSDNSKTNDRNASLRETDKGLSEIIKILNYREN